LKNTWDIHHRIEKYLGPETASQMRRAAMRKEA